MRRAPIAGDWTDEQNDAIVPDYFAMLADESTGTTTGLRRKTALSPELPPIFGAGKDIPLNT
ncbi:MAG: hypothetical protein ACRCVA_08890 [Phreatobacter sp.]